MKQSGPGRLRDQETPRAELASHVSSIELLLTSFSGNIHHGNKVNLIARSLFKIRLELKDIHRLNFVPVFLDLYKVKQSIP